MKNIILIIIAIIILYTLLNKKRYVNQSEGFFLINNIKDLDCLTYLDGSNSYNFGEEKKVFTFGDKKFPGGNCKKISWINSYDLPKQCCYEKTIREDKCSRFKNCEEYKKYKKNNKIPFRCGECQLYDEKIMLEGTLFGPMQKFAAYCKPGTKFEWDFCDKSYDLDYQVQNY